MIAWSIVWNTCNLLGSCQITREVVQTCLDLASLLKLAGSKFVLHHFSLARLLLNYVGSPVVVGTPPYNTVTVCIAPTAVGRWCKI